MKLFFDFFPILVFFIAYKTIGIYAATSTAIAASFLQVGFYWFRHRSLEKMHIVTLIGVSVLGGATLLLKDPIFIKWKPSVIYWVFSAVFFGSQFIGKKLLIEHLLDKNVALHRTNWKALNISWIIFFFIMGFANLYVVYNFSTDVWVNFKLFGTLGLTILFVIIQAFYIQRHLLPEQQAANQSEFDV